MDEKTDIASFDMLFGAQLLNHKAKETDPPKHLGLKISAPAGGGLLADDPDEAGS